MKPRIIVTSKDTDDTFNWLSDGWNSVADGTAGTEGSRRLMSKALGAIELATDVPDAINRLECAGFEVERA